PGAQLGVLQEPVVGLAGAVAVELIEGAVKLVGAAFGDQGDLGSGGTSLAGAVVGGGHAELIHRKLRGRQNAIEGVAGELVVVADAIEGDVVLVAALAVHHAGARVVVVGQNILAIEG